MRRKTIVKDGLTLLSIVLFIGLSVLSVQAKFDLKTNQSNPQKYFDCLTENISQLKEAKKAGLLVDILYNPSKSQLTILLTESLEKHLKDVNLVNKIVNLSIGNFLKLSGKKRSCFVIKPSYTNLFGKKYPVYYIIVFAYALEIAQNDKEIRNQLLHELQHIKDFYYGIQFDDLDINWENLRKKEMNIEFFRNLLELRAYHCELTNIFTDYFRKRKENYSRIYLFKVGMKYSHYWFNLGKKVITPFEKKVAEIQLRNYQDIKPIFIGEDLRIDFNTLQNQLFLYFKKEKIKFD